MDQENIKRNLILLARKMIRMAEVDHERLSYFKTIQKAITSGAFTFQELGIKKAQFEKKRKRMVTKKVAMHLERFRVEPNMADVRAIKNILYEHRMKPKDVGCKPEPQKMRKIFHRYKATMYLYIYKETGDLAVLAKFIACTTNHKIKPEQIGLSSEDFQNLVEHSTTTEKQN